MNRRGFRYSPCEASRLLPALAYRGTEYAPFSARINFEDMNAQVYINSSGMGIATEKGWRMARANVGVREGAWYFECKILNGITAGDVARGHVRVGWARREAPLDAPVGFDAYSYGLRDQGFDKVHMSRPRPFVPGGSFETGDVIGVEIALPTLEEQRLLTEDPAAKSGDIVRDRLPIRFKNQLWFESFEYQPTKEYEDLMSPAAPAKPSSSTPKTLPGSYIKVYKNGELVGTPFEDLYAFLPPASKPLAALGGRELDDGGLGYYPAISVFKGGAAEFNLGPKWMCPPKELGDNVRPVCERYDEQIAEDVLYDLVDEVDLVFTPTDENEQGADGAKSHAAGGGHKEEIKEMVIDDE
jgi:COMPASS component BRE2